MIWHIRVFVLSCAAAYAIGVHAAPAEAATARIAGSHVWYEAAAGEANDVTVSSPEGNPVWISDYGATITAGPGCTSFEPKLVRCETDPAAPPRVLHYRLGDRRDVLAGFYGGVSSVTIDARGGDGDDTLHGASGGDILLGEDGSDLLVGFRGDDVLGDLDSEPGYDRLLGGPGNDQLRGGSERDFLDGGSGDDSVGGQRGGDFVRGGPGNDHLHGGRGNDWLIARDGRRDRVDGSRGFDRACIDGARDRVMRVELLPCGGGPALTGRPIRP